MIDRLWKLTDRILNAILSAIPDRIVDYKTRNSVTQFVKFCMVGVLNNVVSYVTYLVLIRFGIHYTLANAIGFSISVVNSYYWNNRYVFISEGVRVWWRVFIRTYISYAGTGIVLNSLLLYIWIDLCDFSPIIAPLINIVLIVPINFLLNKLWAYKKD